MALRTFAAIIGRPDRATAVWPSTNSSNRAWSTKRRSTGFLARREVPIVEGRHGTFLFRGEADEVYLAQRILGLPSRLPMRRVSATTLWHVVLKVPQGSRINYQIEVRRGDAR